MYPIPANATRIRYVQANGIAYIDTGVPCSTKYTIKAKGQIISNGSGNASYLGWWLRTGTLSDPTAIEATMRLYWRMESSAFCAQSCATEPRTFFSGAMEDVVEFTLSNGSVTTNGVTQTTATITHEDLTHTQHLFGVYNKNPANGEDGHFMQDASTIMRIWYAKWYDENGNLVRDFVPVRVGKDVYMFDRVTGTLFGKQGEGTFTAGSDTFQQGVVPTRMMAMGVRTESVAPGIYVEFDNVTSAYAGLTNYTDTLRFDLTPTVNAMNWSIWLRDGQTLPNNPSEFSGISICDPNTGGDLVMLWNGAYDFASIAGIDTSSPTVDHPYNVDSGTITITKVSA